MKKKSSLTQGLPISFLDAIGLALAAMLLLMFTNLSALQSKEPPPKRHHLLAKLCFSEVDLGRILWNVRWRYRSQIILDTRIQADLSRSVILGKETPFSERRLFSKPFEKKMRSGQSLLHLYGTAHISVSENQSILCYSLALAFPLRDEPRVEFEIERAGAIPYHKIKQITSDDHDRSCWKKAVLIEEKADIGDLLARVYPLPFAINVTAHTTAAKSEFSFSTKTWAVPQEGARCGIKKILYQISLVDAKLTLKQIEVNR